MNSNQPDMCDDDGGREKLYQSRLHMLVKFVGQNSGVIGRQHLWRHRRCVPHFVLFIFLFRVHCQMHRIVANVYAVYITRTIHVRDCVIVNEGFAATNNCWLPQDHGY